MTVLDFSDRAIAKREADRRRAEADERAPAVLLPPEAFSDVVATDRDFRRLCEPGAGTGRRAAAVHRRLMGSLRRMEEATQRERVLRRGTSTPAHGTRAGHRPHVGKGSHVPRVDRGLGATRIHRPSVSWRRSTSRRSTTAAESAKSTDGR